MNRAELQYLMQKYNIEPRREQGQNFLLHDKIVASMIAAAQLTPNDTVLEIGPGLGILTTALAAHAGRVVAVEQDRTLCQALQPLVKQYKNITLINEDIRTFHTAQHGLEHQQYLIVANLPYSITSWILRQFTEYAPAPKRMVVMIQKEVAERVASTPGSMSILSVAVQLFCTVKILRTVTRSNFYPVPNVDSAVILLERRPQPLSSDPAALMKLVKIGFAAKRKQLQNTIQAGTRIPAEQTIAALTSIGLLPTARPQELSVEQWELLRRALFPAE